MKEKEPLKPDGATPIEQILVPTKEERRVLDEKAQKFDEKMKALFERIGIK